MTHRAPPYWFESAEIACRGYESVEKIGFFGIWMCHDSKFAAKIRIVTHFFAPHLHVGREASIVVADAIRSVSLVMVPWS